MIKIIQLSCFVVLGAYPTWGQIKEHRTEGDRQIGYLEYLPPDFNLESPNKHPILFFLHGIGEKGDGLPAKLNKLT